MTFQKGSVSWNKGLKTGFVYAEHPEIREKLSRKIKETHKNPEILAKISKRSKKLWEDTGHREKMRLRTINQWKNPDFKKETSEKIKLGIHKSNRILASKSNWQKKSYRYKMIKSLKEYYINHPERIEELKKLRSKLIFPIKDTSIEVALQNTLTERGISFTKHKPITGQPDIFIEPNICIFADGCYWHACEQCYDKNKFGSIQRVAQVRDIFVTQKLINDGYIVLRFWEHEIKKNVDLCVLQIKDKIYHKEMI